VRASAPRRGCARRALAQDGPGPGSPGRVRKKASHLKAPFQRLRSRRGPKKAICALAASMLTAIDHMLKTGTASIDSGPDHGRKAAPTTHARALVRQIERLGCVCEIKPGEPDSIVTPKMP
jgi:hypothetical protein